MVNLKQYHITEETAKMNAFDKVGILLLILSPIQLSSSSYGKVIWIWKKMSVNYYKPNQVVIPIELLFQM